MSQGISFQGVSAFEGLSAAQIDTLVGLLEIQHFDDGHTFIEEGQPGDSAYFLLEGEVSVTRSRASGSTAREINRMVPNEIFGLISLIDSGERSATCRARGKVKAGTLTRGAFENLRSSAPAIVHHLQRTIARQIARDHRFLSSQIGTAILSGKATEALKSLDDIVLTESYKGHDRRSGQPANWNGPERRSGKDAAAH